MATTVTPTRHNVALYVHCLSCSRLIREHCMLYCLCLLTEIHFRDFHCVSDCFYLSLRTAESLATVKLNEHCCDRSETDVMCETRFSKKKSKFCTLLFAVGRAVA